MTHKTYERQLTDRFFSALRNDLEVEDAYSEYSSHIHALESVGLFPDSYTKTQVEEAYRKFQREDVL